MSRGRDLDRLVRWYPAAWRERYGDELTALVEDELGDRRPPWTLRLALLRAGVVERARAGGPVGESRPPADRMRTGALVVLVAWSAAVLAGCAFAKASEHFGDAAPAGALTGARAAYLLAVAAGVVGAVAVTAGAVTALPATRRFLRSGGWPSVRGPVRRAVVSVLVAAAALVPVAAWAHRLDPSQRNGSDPAYSVAFVTWALLVVLSFGLATSAAVAVARRIDLGARARHIEAALAVVVAVATGGLAGAVVLWWATMARAAPWFLAGTAAGSRPGPWATGLVVIGALLAVAVAVAVVGVVQMARARRSLSEA